MRLQHRQSTLLHRTEQESVAKPHEYPLRNEFKGAIEIKRYSKKAEEPLIKAVQDND